MGGGDSKPNPPPSRPVPSGKIRICIVGFKLCPPAGKAHELAGMIAEKLPDMYVLTFIPPPLSPSHSISYETWYYWDASGPFYAFTAEKFADVSFPEHLKGHSSSPFVWLEHPSSDGSGKNSIEPIGGCDHFCEWIQKNLAGQVVCVI